MTLYLFYIYNFARNIPSISNKHPKQSKHNFPTLLIKHGFHRKLPCSLSHCANCLKRLALPSLFADPANCLVWTYYPRTSPSHMQCVERASFNVPFTIVLMLRLRSLASFIAETIPNTHSMMMGLWLLWTTTCATNRKLDSREFGRQLCISRCCWGCFVRCSRRLVIKVGCGSVAVDV